jgi:hypothetical protein
VGDRGVALTPDGMSRTVISMALVNPGTRAAVTVMVVD